MKIKVNNEKPGSAFKLPTTKYDTVPSTSRIKSLARINKRCKAQGSTKSQNRSNSIETMDIDTDLIVTNLNVEDILNNYNT